MSDPYGKQDIPLTSDDRHDIWSIDRELLCRISLNDVSEVGSKVRRIAYVSKPSKSTMLQIFGWVASFKVEISWMIDSFQR
jgi:hypothetical protein